MDTSKKAYVVAIIIQLIYTGMYVVSKAAFNHGMSTFVFIFYRQAAATVLLLPLAIVLESNSVPVVTFFLAVLLRLEVVRLRSPSGMAKAAGVALCLAGVLTIALYTGPSMSPVNHHRAFAGSGGAAHENSSSSSNKGTWIKGTFLMLLSNTTWSLWIVLQASLLKEYPNKLLSTLVQCLMSTAQSFLLAVAVVRDPAAWKLRLDVGLLAVGYSGLVVTGVSFYLQAWCIEKRGPVFLAMSNPLGLLLTIFCSSFFLGEIVHLGSLIGSALLVGGLYSVLWGKSKDHLHHQPPSQPEATKHQSTGGICTGNDDDEEKQQRKEDDETQLKDLFAMEASPSPLRRQSDVPLAGSPMADADGSRSRSARLFCPWKKHSSIDLLLAGRHIDYRSTKMDAKKPYLIAVIIQLIYTGMFVVSKAAFDHGMNTYVFIFYRQAAASLLLLPLALLLESLKFTSATVASATTNAMPVVTFCFALLLKMEVVKLRSSSGLAKLAGVSLCLAGVSVIAFYVGPALSPVNHHRTFAASHAAYSTGAAASSRTTWIKGTFLMVIANMAWSLWIVLQGRMLKECPNKMLLTVTQCVFSAVQSFVVAAVAERDFSKWSLRFDISLLAGFVVTGVTYYLQAWCVEMKGPVFLAVWNPLCFIFTIFCSSFLLGEIVHLGR
ncbi:hypothetical protein HU200_020153 [Digitaria exilis]|uniref:EamA domain-containing protein n=1 Tax=Digitaria exilis TaxID=1010633 RepID=A0A835KD33_9POAL|nr:hypothetical protein HU200_020153 [Digitaria exilis]